MEYQLVLPSDEKGCSPEWIFRPRSSRCTGAGSRKKTSKHPTRGHSDHVYAVAFSPEDQLLASASMDKTVRLWNVVTGALHAIFADHSDKVWAVAFSSDEQLLVSGSSDGTARLWNVKTGRVAWNSSRPFAFHHESRVFTRWPASGIHIRRLHRQTLECGNGRVT